MTDVTITVAHEHDIGYVQVMVRRLALSVGFSVSDVQRIVTAASELASNLVFHTVQGGSITIKSVQDNDRTGIELIAEDNGPGIPDIEKAMEDGFSTLSGSLGCGLSAVGRLMNEMEIFSEKGTKIIARKWCT